MKLFYRSTVVVVAVFALMLWYTGATTYPQYNGSPACDDCHPGFLGGFSGPLHSAHLAFAGDCMMCHNAIGDNPPLSNCAGCHLQDGLVLHHTNAGAPPDGNGLSCGTCHPGAVLGNEGTVPPYYLLASSSVKNPCVASSADGGEDYDGDGFGLDNDGDLVYDEADPDCAVPVEETTWGLIKSLYDI